MYKVYINGKPVFLTTPGEAAAIRGNNPSGAAGKRTADAYFSLYTGKKKLIRQYLDLLNKNDSVRMVVLYASDLQQLWQDFQSCFTVLEAAGGYVTNRENALLVFFRRGSWDLPKGKIDPGETPEQAAVREVMEETGLVNVDLGEFLCHTYHTYRLKETQVLKKTWWYRMKTADTKVVPQTSEDIEEIQWVQPHAWLAETDEVYGSIKDVIQIAIQ
jgi:ADP-ribose pyrophosphatase YjhB (NUDIX family)